MLQLTDIPEDALYDTKLKQIGLCFQILRACLAGKCSWHFGQVTVRVTIIFTIVNDRTVIINSLRGFSTVIFFG